MSSEKAPPEEDAALLKYFLKAHNFQTGELSVSLSDVTSYLKVDLDSLARALRSLSARGLVRLAGLPSNLMQTYVDQVQKEIDILDLRYLERDLPVSEYVPDSYLSESEYLSLRRVLTDQLKIFSQQPEPLSPLEAAKLFRERDQKLEQMILLTESSLKSHASEILNSELLSLAAKLRPFKNFVLSRINEVRSNAEKSPDPLDEKRTRMLLLFSQVGLSRLATVEEVAQDLLGELEVLRARKLVGEISESDLKEKEQALWKEILKRMTPQLPDYDALVRWMRKLNTRLEAVRSLRDKGILTEDAFRAISEELNADITLLKSHVSDRHLATLRTLNRI